MTGRRTAVVLGGLALVVVVGVIVALAPGMLHGGRVTPTTAGPAPHFVDETASSGLDHTY
jgi:hypothetical protein